MKYRISTPLMIENQVSNPIVPPIAESISTNLADLSFVILMNVGVSKYILTSLKSVTIRKSSDSNDSRNMLIKVNSITLYVDLMILAKKSYFCIHHNQF